MTKTFLTILIPITLLQRARWSFFSFAKASMQVRIRTEEVRMSSSQDFMVAIDFFNNRLKPLPVKYHSIEKALCKLHGQANPAISKLATAACLSLRQFENHFKELTGFSARTYVKLARFERLVEAGTLSQNNEQADRNDNLRPYPSMAKFHDIVEGTIRRTTATTKAHTQDD